MILIDTTPLVAMCDSRDSLHRVAWTHLTSLSRETFVFDWIEKYADHEPDWADGYIAALCGRDRTLKVWTYDKEFRTTWRRPDGSAIPLAVRT